MNLDEQRGKLEYTRVRAVTLSYGVADPKRKDQLPQEVVEGLTERLDDLNDKVGLVLPLRTRQWAT